MGVTASSAEQAAAAWPARALRRWRGARRGRLALSIVVGSATVVLCYLAVSSIDLSLAWRATRSSDYGWLAPAFVAFLASVLTRALRWRSLFARGRRPPVGAVVNATFIGYLYNAVAPARAGEAARIVVLTQRSSAPPSEILATVVVERLYDVLAILVIFLVAAPWLPHVSWLGTAAIAAAAVAALIVLSAAVLAVGGDRPLRLLLRPVGRLRFVSQERLDGLAVGLAHGLAGFRHTRLAAEAALWTICAWLLTALCAYLVARGFHLGLPFQSGVLVAVAVGVGMILPSLPAAVGVFEGAVLIALAAYGVPRSTALPFAVVLHLVNLVPFLVVGVVLVHRNSRRAGARRAGSVEQPTAGRPAPAQEGQPDQLYSTTCRPGDSVTSGKIASPPRR